MDILSKAIESPNQLFDQFGEPTQGGIQKIYQSDKFFNLKCGMDTQYVNNAS